MIDLLRFAHFEIWGLALILGSTLFPRIIWHKDSGRYRGFLNWEFLAHALVFGLYIGIFAWPLGTAGGNLPQYMIVNFLVLLIVARITVELWHRKQFGEWLHRKSGAAKRGGAGA